MSRILVNCIKCQATCNALCNMTFTCHRSCFKATIACCLQESTWIQLTGTTDFILMRNLHRLLILLLALATKQMTSMSAQLSSQNYCSSISCNAISIPTALLSLHRGDHLVKLCSHEIVVSLQQDGSSAIFPNFTIPMELSTDEKLSRIPIVELLVAALLSASKQRGITLDIDHSMVRGLIEAQRSMLCSLMRDRDNSSKLNILIPLTRVPRLLDLRKMKEMKWLIGWPRLVSVLHLFLGLLLHSPNKKLM